MRTTLVLLNLLLCGIGPRLLGAEALASASPPRKADLVIVGTGISGLAAALDAGRAGVNVTVIDMWSVFGGHAVMSGGLVCLVDTPFQRTNNVADSPDPDQPGPPAFLFHRLELDRHTLIQACVICHGSVKE